MKRLLLLILIAVLLAACGAAQDGAVTAPSAPVPVESAEGGDFFEREMPAAEPAPPMDADSPATAQVPQTRRIVYTANIRLRADEPQVTARALHQLATRFGGYVSSANVYQVRDNAYEASIQVRVNADRFDTVLEEIRALGTEVLDEQLDTQDVTDRYVDLEARIDNLERTETELQALLADARREGGEMEDILAIYRELSRVREQIEVHQGQLNVLADAVQLATINITLVPPQATIAVVDDEWNPMQTVRRAVRTLTGGLQALADAGIFFAIAIAPVLLILALLFFLFIRAILWLRRRAPQQRPPAPTAD
jgi:hypothetical protein